LQKGLRILWINNLIKKVLVFISVIITIFLLLEYINSSKVIMYKACIVKQLMTVTENKSNNEYNQYNISLSRGASVKNPFYSPSEGIVTSSFGMRWGKMHNGIDIGSPMGSPIYAAMDGKVSCREWQDGYGNVIKIEHEANIETVYAHCSNMYVSVGEYVRRGEKIGEVGSTGRSTGPHVHFEIRVKGVPQNPLAYLK
jgi:murein DD-endopeptidase MepM/ murein hydrolase activator NlpD